MLLKEEVRLWILVENGLLKQETAEDERIYTLVEHIGDKVNIVDSPSYRYVMTLKSAIMRQMEMQGKE